MAVTKPATLKSKMARGKDYRNEFSDLCGVGTVEEAERFLESIWELEVVESAASPTLRRNLTSGRRSG